MKLCRIMIRKFIEGGHELVNCSCVWGSQIHRFSGVSLMETMWMTLKNFIDGGYEFVASVLRS